MTRLSFLPTRPRSMAKAGGQTGDSGSMTTPAGFKATVTDTAKPLGRLHAHQVRIDGGQTFRRGRHG